MIAKYPDNWPEIANRIKDAAGRKCERCGMPDSQTPDGNCLTVHHLVPDPSLCEDWNLAALCQRCHLLMQGFNLNREFVFGQTYFAFFDVAPWFKPHLEGFLEWRFQCGS